jgi:hypothetical protein
MITQFMASKKQIAWRKKFAKLYGNKKKATTTFKKRQAKVDKDSKEKGYLPKVKGKQMCPKCGRKTLGSQDAWFQDFTGQRRICSRCIKEQRANRPKTKGWKNKK